VSDLKLFATKNGMVDELAGSAAGLEKSLQNVFEENLEVFLGVRFLASEFVTTNGGRMDTLGVDENGCPVIIEYKRDRSENVINQGLFYLDWLMDHKGDFEILVRDKYGKESADAIEWRSPRLICIANDFTKYDEHAVNQMGRNIELVRYRRFGNELLLLELLTVTSVKVGRATRAPAIENTTNSGTNVYTTVSQHLENADNKLRNLFDDLQAYLLGMGDDVQEKTLRFYIAFRRIKNFACVEIRRQNARLLVYLKVDPDTTKIEPGFTRDVRKIGHYGTGDLEVTITDQETLERAKPLILKSYEKS